VTLSGANKVHDMRHLAQALSSGDRAKNDTVPGKSVAILGMSVQVAYFQAIDI